MTFNQLALGVKHIPTTDLPIVYLFIHAAVRTPLKPPHLLLISAQGQRARVSCNTLEDCAHVLYGLLSVEASGAGCPYSGCPQACRWTSQHDLYWPPLAPCCLLPIPQPASSFYQTAHRTLLGPPTRLGVQLELLALAPTWLSGCPHALTLPTTPVLLPQCALESGDANLLRAPTPHHRSASSSLVQLACLWRGRPSPQERVCSLWLLAGFPANFTKRAPFVSINTPINSRRTLLCECLPRAAHHSPGGPETALLPSLGQCPG